MLHTEIRYRAFHGAFRTLRPRHVLTIRSVSTQDAPTPTNSRIERVSARLPKLLQPTIRPMLSAPLSHITSFLILHELTAIVPLVSLAATFHYSNWLPPYITEGAWVKQGIERFGPYLRKKGWLGEEDSRREGTWAFSEGSVKIVVEVASAWAITKALLPIRLIVSVWAAPWFARGFILPITGWLGKIFGGGKKPPRTSPATGAPQVRNDGPLYKEKSTASSSDAPTPSGSSAASGPATAGSGASHPGVLPKGVKNDGPLYKNAT